MSTSIPMAAFKKTLLIATFFYLALPVAIFFIGWLTWPWAVGAVMALLIPFYFLLREQTAGESGELSQAGVTVWQIAAAFGIALIVSVLSGVGGLANQYMDWDKHNAILHDLAMLPWPVRYDVGAWQIPLVYYLAGYLPAALAGKLLGAGWINPASIVWITLGFGLSILWIFSWTGKGILRAAALLICFSGLDLIGYLLITPLSSLFIGFPTPLESLEYWSIAWEYTSHASLLVWTPHIGIAAWLSGAALLFLVGDRHNRRLLVWLLGLTLLWCPFITFGLVWLLPADFLLRNEGWPQRIRSYATWENLCGIVLAAVLGLYFLAKFYPPLPPELSAPIDAGWMFSYAEDAFTLITMLVVLLLFCALEFGVYFFLVGRLRPDWNADRRNILIATCLLLVFPPLYRFGYFNDLMLKVPMPLLFILCVFVAQAISLEPPLGRMRFRKMLSAAFAIGMVTTGIIFFFQLQRTPKFWATRFPIDMSSVEGLPELRDRYAREGTGEWEEVMEEHGQEFRSFFQQYIGSPDSAFFEFLAPQQERQVTAE